MGAIGSTFIILGLFLLVFTAYRSNFSVSYQTGVMYAVASSLCVLGLMMYGVVLVDVQGQANSQVSFSVNNIPSVGDAYGFSGRMCGSTSCVYHTFRSLSNS